MTTNVHAPMAAQVLDVIVEADSAPSTPILSDTKTDNAPVTSPAHTITAPKKATPGTRDLGLIRFRVPKKSECFIASGPESYHDMIAMIKRECPSLTDWPADKLTVHITCDPGKANMQGVLFRVTADSWPGAVTDVMQLVVICKVQNTGQDAARVRDVKPLNELSEAERMAFSEEMSGSIGKLRLQGFSGERQSLQETSGAGQYTWDEAVERQVVLGDGISSSPRLANALTQGVSDVPAGSWADLQQKGAVLGDGQERPSSSLPLADASHGVEVPEGSWADLQVSGVAIGDGQQVSSTGAQPAPGPATAASREPNVNDAGDVVASSWRDAVDREMVLDDH